MIVKSSVAVSIALLLPAAAVFIVVLLICMLTALRYADGSRPKGLGGW